MIITSVFKFLNLAKRAARSLASESPKRLVSSNWVVREILFFPSAAIAFSVSSIWRVRSWFSTWSFFLEESASFRARAISSSFWLASTMRPWVSFPFLSWLALSLIASSREALASWRSLSMFALSFSDLAFILLRESICSPISDMLLLCFCLKAARVPSWAILDSSNSALSFASSASLFLLSSIWVAVLFPASSNFSAKSSISLERPALFFSALARACLSIASSSSSSSKRDWSSLICLLYLLAKVCSSSILAETDASSFSFLWMVWLSSLFTLSRSETASWVSFKSPSTFLFILSTSPLDFFSLSKESSHSSRACSSFPFTLFKWLHLSSKAWISSSVFWRDSPTLLFSFWSLEINSSWWAISSFKVRIWLSLVILSSSQASMLDSNVLISPLSLSASALTFPHWESKLAMASSSLLTRLLVSSNCFWMSFFMASIRLVLSMISWTADPPLCNARTNSFFSLLNLS